MLIMATNFTARLRVAQRQDTKEPIRAVEVVSPAMRETADGRPVIPVSEYIGVRDTPDGRPVRAVSTDPALVADGEPVIPVAIFAPGALGTADGRPIMAVAFYSYAGLATPYDSTAVYIFGSPSTNAEETVPYSFTPSASGGTTPYTFSYTGSLPPGLTFAAATGAITGTPTTAGTYGPFVITVTDAAATPATASLPAFSIEVAEEYVPPPPPPPPSSDAYALEDDSGVLLAENGEPLYLEAA